MSLVAPFSGRWTWIGSVRAAVRVRTIVVVAARASARAAVVRCSTPSSRHVCRRSAARSNGPVIVIVVVARPAVRAGPFVAGRVIVAVPTVVVERRLGGGRGSKRSASLRRCPWRFGRLGRLGHHQARLPPWPSPSAPRSRTAPQPSRRLRRPRRLDAGLRPTRAGGGHPADEQQQRHGRNAKARMNLMSLRIGLSLKSPRTILRSPRTLLRQPPLEGFSAAPARLRGWLVGCARHVRPSRRPPAPCLLWSTGPTGSSSGPDAIGPSSRSTAIGPTRASSSAPPNASASNDDCRLVEQEGAPGGYRDVGDRDRLDRLRWPISSSTPSSWITRPSERRDHRTGGLSGAGRPR